MTTLATTLNSLTNQILNIINETRDAAGEPRETKLDWEQVEQLCSEASKAGDTCTVKLCHQWLDAPRTLGRLMQYLRMGVVPCDDKLPVYGGEPPADTDGVWSWSETHLLVGDSVADLRLVPRSEW